MSQPPNTPREPISPARNGASGASVALQTALILWGLQRGGIQGTPEEIATLACGIAAGWAFIAGAIARVSRDELHRMATGEVQHGVLVRLVLELGSLLG